MPDHASNISGKSFEFFWDYAYENMEWHVTDAQCYLICGDRSFDRARKSIDEHFDVVGISEDFQSFYNALRSVAPFVRLPADYSDHIGNVAPAASSVSGEMLGQKLPDWRERIPPALLRRIERDNANDLALYDYLRRRGGLVTRAH